LANTEFMFPYVSVVKCPQDEMLKRIGSTLVASGITYDEKFQRELVDATHIDRLNLGPVPTYQLDWLQPHEGNIVEFLFRPRAFQARVDKVAVLKVGLSVRVSGSFNRVSCITQASIKTNPKP